MNKNFFQIIFPSSIKNQPENMNIIINYVGRILFEV